MILVSVCIFAPPDVHIEARKLSQMSCSCVFKPPVYGSGPGRGSSQDELLIPDIEVQRLHSLGNAHAHTHAHTHTNKQTNKETCTYRHTHTHTHSNMHNLGINNASIHSFIHGHTHPYAHKQIWTCTHTHTHPYTHTHTHTHTYTKQCAHVHTHPYTHKQTYKDMPEIEHSYLILCYSCRSQGAHVYPYLLQSPDGDPVWNGRIHRPWLVAEARQKVGDLPTFMRIGK